MSSDDAGEPDASEAAEAAEAAEADRPHPLVDTLASELGDDVVGRETRNNDSWLRVSQEAWRRTAETCRRLGFDYFCFLSAIDWAVSPFGRSENSPLDPPKPEATTDMGAPGVTGGETRFQLLARVYSIARRAGITFKADLPDDGPVAETWSGVYAGANWMERETHEMFGIGFAGHPYLVNLYLPGAFEGHPLRKDFPLLAREVKPWPGLVDVEAMPGEPAEEPAAAGTEA